MAECGASIVEVDDDGHLWHLDGFEVYSAIHGVGRVEDEDAGVYLPRDSGLAAIFGKASGWATVPPIGGPVPLTQILGGLRPAPCCGSQHAVRGTGLHAGSLGYLHVGVDAPIPALESSYPPPRLDPKTSGFVFEELMVGGFLYKSGRAHVLWQNASGIPRGWEDVPSLRTPGDRRGVTRLAEIGDDLRSVSLLETAPGRYVGFAQVPEATEHPRVLSVIAGGLGR